MQECSNSEQLHEKEERVHEGSPLTEKENTEHATTSTTDSASSVAVTVLEADRCGSATCLQQGALDVSQKLFAESQQPKYSPWGSKELHRTEGLHFHFITMVQG